ncbi:MAG: amidohydrolase family protein [Nitrospirota bacterium]|jgi:5-methylthioadenosine/S-adenosylhomocysteine deaminase
MILSAEIILPVSYSPIFNAAILIENGKIRDIGIKDEIINRYRSHELMEFKDAALMPGLINLHAHLELTALKDRIFKEDTELMHWILRLVDEKKATSAEVLSSGSEKGITEAISTGTTTISDISTNGESFYKLKKTGIRGIVYKELLNFDDTKALCCWKKAIEDIESLRKDETALLSIGISPHSPYSVSPRLLGLIQGYAEKENLKLTMHVSESREEIKFISEDKGPIKDIYLKRFKWDKYKRQVFGDCKSPVEYLEKEGLLSPEFLLVHGVHLNNDDIKRLARKGVPVVHCPRSNVFIGVGVAPFYNLISEGITVGLGTDSCASNYSLNMWDEMRFAYLLHNRINDKKITAEDIIMAATINGAKALGLDDKTGTIEIGKEADIIAVRFPKRDTDIYPVRKQAPSEPHKTCNPLKDEFSNGVYRDLLLHTVPNDIIMTMVAGKVIYQKELKDVN